MAYKIGMISLGCPKNQVDAEIMLNILRQNGFEICSDLSLADAVIVNTCGFIESAKAESIEQILDLAVLKREGNLKSIVVTGCMAERYREQVQKELPEADAVVGIGSNADIAEIVMKTLGGESLERFADKLQLPLDGQRVLSTPYYYAYLKIAEGCDNCCTYCAIPAIRGRFRSRKMESILEEAEALVRGGVKELILVAQDTTRYGEDIYGEPYLALLLTKLAAIPGAKWIRLLYTYPERIDDRLLDVMAAHDNILNYLDIPIQHCNAEILRRMNRKGDRRSLTKLIARIRNKLPGVTLRTTLIAGFPGETERQFGELCEFVKEMSFDRLGCFAYSKEEGTAAAKFENQIETKEKQRRQELIMQHQAALTEQNNALKAGTLMQVLVEGYDKELKCYFGRGRADAPEIDGMVYFTSKHILPTGSFAEVRIKDCIDYDFLGEAEEKHEESET